MTRDSLKLWFTSMVEAMGHGGKVKASEALGISQSRITRLIQSGKFDEKTLLCVSWLLESKAENLTGTWVIEQTIKINGYTFDRVRHCASFNSVEGYGESFWTWRLDKPTEQSLITPNARDTKDDNGQSRNIGKGTLWITRLAKLLGGRRKTDHLSDVQPE